MILAPCGLDCEKCLAHIATIKNDDTLKEEAAKNWTLKYNIIFTPEMINCTGCTVNGAKTPYNTYCPIRECVISKNIANCSLCDEYPCQNIKSLHNIAPEAKENLQKLK